MSVKYKKNGTWYDIGSSSNNAVDAIENGNLNPVTSNAVYDYFNPTSTNVTITVPGVSNVPQAVLVKTGKVVQMIFQYNNSDEFPCSTDGWTTIGTVPTGYRPKYGSSGLLSSNDHKSIIIHIATNGEITARLSRQSYGGHVEAIATWVIA